MATSESDDFESANEDTGHDIPAKRRNQARQWSSPTAIDSESDDDTEYVPRQPCTNFGYGKKPERFSSYDTAALAGDRTPAEDRSIKTGNETGIEECGKNESQKQVENSPEVQTVAQEVTVLDTENAQTSKSEMDTANLQVKIQEQKEKESLNKSEAESLEKKNDVETQRVSTNPEPKERTRPRNQRRPEGSRQLGAKKLGTRIVQNSNPKTDAETKKDNAVEDNTSVNIETQSRKESSTKVSITTDVASEDRLSELSKDLDGLSTSFTDDFVESDMPEELKSNKKFKEIFKPEGWEALGNDIELPEELTEEKLQPVLERLSLAGPDSETSAGWGGWSNWGVSSFINTATAGVSTITSHVSHGLTLLEESIAVPEPSETSKGEQLEELRGDEIKPDVPEESQLYNSFGFGNLISGVSSITKLVESTGSKVVTGGLDTLEAIGKKTMEVLQEGDPGLKKKRAFFMNEADKPILSQILREAKDKAESAEKSFEEKQWARKVHFESLFDDYQGLVHLEALEMLSRQSNIKIQQHLVGLESNELTSVQETLEEVKELFDLEDEEDEEENDKDLKARLQEACTDLGVHITYEKLHSIWEESQSYLAPPLTHTDQEIFQSAISALAQFTAFSVERFHKTAELLLIKERRSTVNEADALVRLTRILSNQIGVLANCYCISLKEIIKTSEKSNDITANLTTVSTEAGNASSYIEDALRLLIPIVQVGAI